MDEGVVTAEDVESEAKRSQEQLQTTLKRLRSKMEAGEYEDPSSTALGTGELDRSRSPEVETAVGQRLRSLNEELLRVPDSFTIHRKLRKPLLARIDKLDQGEIEFGHAEPGVRLAADRGNPSASPVRTPSAGRSRIVTWHCTTRRPACATCRFRT